MSQTLISPSLGHIEYLECLPKFGVDVNVDFKIVVTQTLEILDGLAVVVLYVKRNSINALESLARNVLKTHIFAVFTLQKQEVSKIRLAIPAIVKSLRHIDIGNRLWQTT